MTQPSANPSPDTTKIPLHTPSPLWQTSNHARRTHRQLQNQFPFLLRSDAQKDADNDRLSIQLIQTNASRAKRLAASEQDHACHIVFADYVISKSLRLEMKQPTAILSEVALSWAIFIPAIWLSFPLAHALQPYPNLYFLFWIVGFFFMVALASTDKIIYRHFGINQRISKIRNSNIYDGANNNWQKLLLRASLAASSFFTGSSLLTALVFVRYWLNGVKNDAGPGMSSFTGYVVEIGKLSVGSFLVLVLWFLAWPLIKRGFHNLRAHNLQ